MDPNSTSTPHDGKGRQRLRTNTIEVAVIDCGCWDNEHRFFGAMSGSAAVLARVFVRSEETGVVGGPSAADLQRLAALGPKLDAFLKAVAQFGPNDRYGVEVFNEPVFIEALTEEEEKAKGRATMLTADEELLIFLPDMHLGVLDGADNFAQRSADPEKRLENLRMVEALLRKAKGLGATVYQMGDFLDIWEVEACIDKLPVYFGKSRSTVTIEDRWGPNRIPWKVDRVRRARDAEALIVAKWREAGGALFGYLYEGCELQRLMGNHDIEAASKDGSLGAAPKAKEEGRHWYWDDGRRHCAWRMGRWAAEHGHYYDLFNDTSKCKTVSDVIEKVRGKWITYHYARKDRDERLPEFMVIEAIADRPDVRTVRVADPADHGNPALNIGNYVAAAPVSDDLVRDILGPGWITPRFGPWRGVRDNAERLERSNFDDMRTRLVVVLADAIAGWNKETAWASPLEFVATNRATRSFFVTAPETRETYGFKPPLNLPFRVLFHGHTHQPMIVRLTLAPKTFAPNRNVAPRTSP